MNRNYLIKKILFIKDETKNLLIKNCVKTILLFIKTSVVNKEMYIF